MAKRAINTRKKNYREKRERISNILMATNLPMLVVRGEQIQAKHLPLIEITKRRRLQEHTTKYVT